MWLLCIYTEFLPVCFNCSSLNNVVCACFSQVLLYFWVPTMTVKPKSLHNVTIVRMLKIWSSLCKILLINMHIFLLLHAGRIQRMTALPWSPLNRVSVPQKTWSTARPPNSAWRRSQVRRVPPHVHTHTHSTHPTHIHSLRHRFSLQASSSMLLSQQEKGQLWQVDKGRPGLGGQAAECVVYLCFCVFLHVCDSW